MRKIFLLLTIVITIFGFNYNKIEVSAFNEIMEQDSLEKGFFRYFGEKPFLGIEYFNAKKFKTSSSIHLTFNHFNSVDISLTNGISVWIN